eukprot:gene65987-90298_t
MCLNVTLTKQVAADAREELRKALDDRTTALKRLKEQHAKELAAAIDTASKA